MSHESGFCHVRHDSAESCGGPYRPGERGGDYLGGHKAPVGFVQGGHRRGPGRPNRLVPTPVRTRPRALWTSPDLRSFWPVAVLAAYDSIGFELFGPVLPAVRERAGASALEASLIFGVFSIGLLAGFAAGGATVRRRGPRAAAITGVVLHLVADLLFIAGHSPQTYLVGRLLQGFGSGELWMAAILCVLARWPERPGPWLGRMITAYAVGAVMGPLLATLGGAVRPFVGDAILSTFAFMAAFAMPARHGRTFDWGLSVLRDRRLAFGSLVALFNALVFTTIEGSYTLRFAARPVPGPAGPAHRADDGDVRGRRGAAGRGRERRPGTAGRAAGAAAVRGDHRGDRGERLAGDVVRPRGDPGHRGRDLRDVGRRHGRPDPRGDDAHRDDGRVAGVRDRLPDRAADRHVDHRDRRDDGLGTGGRRGRRRDRRAGMGRPARRRRRTRTRPARGG